MEVFVRCVNRKKITLKNFKSKRLANADRNESTSDNPRKTKFVYKLKIFLSRLNKEILF